MPKTGKRVGGNLKYIFMKLTIAVTYTDITGGKTDISIINKNTKNIIWNANPSFPKSGLQSLDISSGPYIFTIDGNTSGSCKIVISLPNKILYTNTFPGGNYSPILNITIPTDNTLP